MFSGRCRWAEYNAGPLIIISFSGSPFNLKYKLIKAIIVLFDILVLKYYNIYIVTLC